ncbi:MAG: hypothetical protein AABY51_05170 [Deltaproteobacteria bacterium]
MSEQKVIWSFGGGKGLIEKGVAVANIACGLALSGARVLLVDADPLGTGMHTFFSDEKPSYGFDDFLSGSVASLADVSWETGVDGLRLVSVGTGFLRLADPDFPMRKRLLKEVWDLDVGYILVNLGSGASGDILDFFSLSDEGIILLSPEPVSVQGGFDFLRGFVYRRLAIIFSDDLAVSALISEATDARGHNPVKTFSDLCERIASVDRDGAQKAISEIKRFAPQLLLNMGGAQEDVGAPSALASVSKRFLGLDTGFIGTIHSGTGVGSAGRARLFMLDGGEADASKEIEDIISSLIGERQEAPVPVQSIVGSGPGAQAQVQEVFGFNDNVYHEDSVMHVQTEVQGGEDPSIETIIYHGGRIFFSKKTLWSSLAPEVVSAGIKDFATRQHRVAIAAIKLNKISFKG